MIVLGACPRIKAVARENQFESDFLCIRGGIVGPFNENARKIRPKWVFRGRFPILGQTTRPGWMLLNVQKAILLGEYIMNIRFLLAILTMGLITACSSNTPSSDTLTMQPLRPERSRGAENMVAAANAACFHRGTMYSDGGASCQSGLQYRCDNGEWVNLGVSCMEEAVAVSQPCQYSGITFPTGAASCQTGTQYRCEDGYWRSLMLSCSGGDSPIRLSPGGRTCLLEGGSTVATSSSVCRSGTTFLCSDGEWINLGTLCR